MSQFRALLFVFVIGVLGATTSRADSVIGNFNLDPSLNPNASQGSVRFTLQANGTIQGDLFINGPASIVGFGFNSLIANLPEYGFSPAAPDNLFGWASSFGSNPSGFYCPACTVQEEWTIGNPGDYVSVWQILDGGSQSTVDFFLYDSSEREWGAKAERDNPTVPEPGSLLLLGTGALALARAIRRKVCL